MRIAWPRALIRSTAGALENEALRRVGLVFVANTLARGLAFGFFVIAARWLSESAYGEVRAAMAWAALLALLMGPFSLAWTRSLAAAPDEEARRRQTGAGLLALAPLLGATMAIGALWGLLDPAVQPWTLAVLFGLSVFYAVEGFFKGWMAFRSLAIYLFSGNLLQLGLLTALYLLRPDLLSAPAVGFIYAGAYLAPLLWAGAGLLRFSRPAPGAARAMIGASLGLVLFNSANTLIVNVDLVLLGYLASSAEIGYYGVAKTLLSLVLVIAQSVFAVFLPMSASASARGGLRQTVPLVAGATLVLVLGVVIFAEPVVALVFTERYLPAVPALRLLMIGGWFYLLMSLLAARLLGGNADTASRRIYLLAAGLNLALNLALAPALGALGAAIAFLVACVAGAAAALFAWRRARAEPPAPTQGTAQ